MHLNPITAHTRTGGDVGDM